MNRCVGSVGFYILAFVASMVSITLHAQIEKAKPRYRIACSQAGRSLGSIDIELFPLVAPKAVRYFDSLVSIHFYDTTAFHRVVPNFVIQGGDPNSRHGDRSTWGQGDPAQVNVDAEFSPIAYVRGILGAARDPDTNSANSQFFICVANALHLNGQYTVYGQVVAGMDVADTIVHLPRDANDNPLQKVEVFVSPLGENDSIPDAPQCLYPVAAQDLPGSANFRWTRPSGALLYNVEVSEDSSFTQLARTLWCGIYTSAANGPEVQSLGGFTLPYHRYYWRVRANNGGHYSAYSPVAWFETQVASPLLSQPDSASTLQDTLTVLRWHPVDGATAYHLRVATSPLFIASATVVNISSLHDTLYELSSIPAGKKVYWKVSAMHDTVEAPSSSTWYFSSPGSSPVVSPVPSSGCCFPQPANDVLSIPLLSSSADLRIRTMQGSEVLRQQLIGTSNIGDSVPLDVHTLPNGWYLLELTEGIYNLRQLILILH